MVASTTPTTPTRLILRLKPKVMARKRRSSVAGGIRPIIGPRVISSRASSREEAAEKLSEQRADNQAGEDHQDDQPDTALGCHRAASSGDDQRVGVGDDPGLLRDALANELRQAERVLVGDAVPVL